MPVWVHRIETILPEFSFSQEHACLKMQEWAKDDRTRRILRVLYRQSGIERRHSVIADFDGNSEGSFFKTGPGGVLQGPGTGARNEIFARESKAMSVALAGKILDRSAVFGPGDITHVVTASCTGFCNPGPDYHIVRELGMNRSTERYHLGFMGCYAALPALRMAAAFCKARPDAVVLVMCIELCSLHIQVNGNEDSQLANSLFADGAAAAIVSARDPAPGQGAFRIEEFRSAIVPDGEADMAWSIGDRGFDITLSSYVPRLIGASIRGIVEPSLGAGGYAVADVGTWAVHPGGRAIIDQVQSGLSLRPEQVAESREVLRSYGNMSSPSVLFVLKEILERPSGSDSETVCAMAFGPGLTAELALLEAVRAGAGR
ncbi:MAG: type III polyketide synthase, partial [Deltaproteobacteria bacterium]|nr:type III polyketide synthase [Deltaproteobacteria bacterium]